MKKSIRLMAAVIVLAWIGSAASAATITVVASTAQSGFAGSTVASIPLTGDPPYDFTGQNYGGLNSITGISVTLTTINGDSLPGGVNFDQFTLALDGIDTGLKLNGFLGQDQISTVTLNGPVSNSAAILAALQSDGKLVGTIIDSVPGDSAIGLPFLVETSLEITGDGSGGTNPVPLPAAILLAPMGAGLCGAWARRYRRGA